MKIIKHCNYNKVITCECCGIIFEVDDTDLIVDKETLALVYDYKNIYHTYAQCPVCKTYNEIEFIKSEENDNENRNN